MSHLVFPIKGTSHSARQGRMRLAGQKCKAKLLKEF
jgi:hypothetical protein